VVLNSCLYDSRILLGNIDKGDKFVLKVICADGTIADCGLGHYTYNTSDDCYYGNIDNIEFTPVETDAEKGYYLFEASKALYSEKEFKNSSQVRLYLKGSGTCYIQEIELFKAYYTDNGTLITPNTQADSLEQRVIDKTYYYFTKENLEGIASEDE
jgi:hypothetical protein